MFSPFLGHEVIIWPTSDLDGLDGRRVGLAVDGKRPVREGQAVLDSRGRQVGTICSACYGASVGGPIAMAYVEREQGAPGTGLDVDVRGKSVSVTVVRMPFIPQRYYRG